MTTATIGPSSRRRASSRARDPERSPAQWKGSVGIIARRFVLWAEDPATPTAEVIRWWRQVEWALQYVGAIDPNAPATPGRPVAPTPATIPTSDPLAGAARNLDPKQPDPAA
jgi:hypothetical protein